MKNNISQFGKPEIYDLIPGWFEDTMTSFSLPIAIIFMDVDLASSTKTCLKYLYPLLTPGGTLYSQDGHLPLVIQVFDDEKFWSEEVGSPKAYIQGLGKRKLIKIVKPLN